MNGAASLSRAATRSRAIGEPVEILDVAPVAARHPELFSGSHVTFEAPTWPLGSFPS